MDLTNLKEVDSVTLEKAFRLIARELFQRFSKECEKHAEGYDNILSPYRYAKQWWNRLFEMNNTLGDLPRYFK